MCSYILLRVVVFFSVGTVVTAPTEPPTIQYELKLVPSVNEVVRFENDSYLVSCHAPNTRLRWLDPDNSWVDRKRGGGVHVEQRGNELVLMFQSLSADTDNGTWTCQSEMDNQKITFNMIVYSTY